ncbi:MAG: YgeY family selenium metabolism-linked hydrolase [Chloroflexota bacterium]|nr:YgeY family selenium metabolism-linked hydrolase [Chloroflexota bacterium]
MPKLALSDGEQEALTTFVRDLVRTPSPSCQEGAVARRLAAEMEAVGLESVHADRAGNVVGRLGSGSGPVLVFNGHMDHVGAGDLAAWSRDPFGASLEAGVVYGRGACDMKGPLAALVYGAKLLKDSHLPQRGTLYVVGAVQEETCEGLGMRLLMEEEGLKPDFVVLGEPSNLVVALGQRGRMEMRVTTRGKASHGSAPERGDNAIYKMARLALGVEALNGTLTDDPVLGKGTVSLTIISGGNDHNVVPETCTAFLDRRLSRGEDEATAVQEIGHIAAEAGVLAEVEVLNYRSQSYTGLCCEARLVFPAWDIRQDHPLVRAVFSAAAHVLGHSPGSVIWRFSTDGAYTAGVAGIPTIGFGPGEERYAHTVEDQIRMADVVTAAHVYARLGALLLDGRLEPA